MDLRNISARPSNPTDRIYVSWTEYWDLVRYVDHYITSRNYPVTDQMRAKIRECMAKYPGGHPLKKADMDFYLDSNAKTTFATR
jgi:hypothetical protein